MRECFILVARGLSDEPVLLLDDARTRGPHGGGGILGDDARAARRAPTLVARASKQQLDFIFYKVQGATAVLAQSSIVAEEKDGRALQSAKRVLWRKKRRGEKSHLFNSILLFSIY